MTNAGVLGGDVSPNKPHQLPSTGLQLSVVRTELLQPQSVPMGQVDKGISEI